MVQAAQTQAHKGTADSNEAASLKNYGSSVKVVAGARSLLFRTPVSAFLTIPPSVVESVGFEPVTVGVRVSGASN